MTRFGRSKWLLQAREGDTNRCSRAFHNGKRKNKFALRRRSAVGQFAFRPRKRARQTFIYSRRMFLRIIFDSEYIREADPRMADIYNAREPAGVLNHQNNNFRHHGATASRRSPKSMGWPRLLLARCNFGWSLCIG